MNNFTNSNIYHNNIVNFLRLAWSCSDLEF